MKRLYYAFMARAAVAFGGDQVAKLLAALPKATFVGGAFLLGRTFYGHMTTGVPGDYLAVFLVFLFAVIFQFLFYRTDDDDTAC